MDKIKNRDIRERCEDESQLCYFFLLYVMKKDKVNDEEGEELTSKQEKSVPHNTLDFLVEGIEDIQGSSIMEN